MSCRDDNLEELKEWLDEVEQAGRRAVAAVRSKEDLDRVGGHLVGRAGFALALARGAVDDIAGYLASGPGTESEEGLLARVRESTKAMASLKVANATGWITKL